MCSQVTEQAKERGHRAHSTARTSWPPSMDFGIDSSIFGHLGEVIGGVAVDSLRCCRIGSSVAGDCISGRPSRANDIILFELRRLHRLVGSGAGAAGPSGGQRDRGSRRVGSRQSPSRLGALAASRSCSSRPSRCPECRQVTERWPWWARADVVLACGRVSRSCGAA